MSYIEPLKDSNDNIVPIVSHPSVRAFYVEQGVQIFDTEIIQDQVMKDGPTKDRRVESLQNEISALKIR